MLRVLGKRAADRGPFFVPQNTTWDGFPERLP